MGAIVTLFITTAIVLVVFLLSSCVIQNDKINSENNRVVRTECIRPGGNWADVHDPKITNTPEYGCVKK